MTRLISDWLSWARGWYDNLIRQQDFSWTRCVMYTKMH